MENYIDFLKECANRLWAAGSPIDKDDLVFHTLDGLVIEFNNLKATFRALSQPTYFAELASLIIVAELHVHRDQPTASDSTSALFFLLVIFSPIMGTFSPLSRW